MAFESLSERLNGVFKKLRGKGKLSEADIKAAMREVRMALLEADVNYKVAKDFCAQVSERAMGQEVMESLTPAQQVVKIVNEELTKLMGGEEPQTLHIKNKGQTVMMMCGLQGNGKNTHAALSGHRGLPTASLFTDLDQMQVGDMFYIKVLGQTLAYQVDQILTVLPEETEHLAIEPGRDLVTLITCTPYGVNSHRLLVRGTRVEYIPEDMQQVMQEQAPKNWFESLPIQFRHGLTGVAVILVVVVLRWLVLLLTKFLKRRKQS